MIHTQKFKSKHSNVTAPQLNSTMANHSCVLGHLRGCLTDLSGHVFSVVPREQWLTDTWLSKGNAEVLSLTLSISSRCSTCQCAVRPKGTPSSAGLFLGCRARQRRTCSLRALAAAIQACNCSTGVVFTTAIFQSKVMQKKCKAKKSVCNSGHEWVAQTQDVSSRYYARWKPWVWATKHHHLPIFKILVC